MDFYGTMQYTGIRRKNNPLCFFYQNAVSVNINKCENQRNTVIFKNATGTECLVMDCMPRNALTAT